MVFLSRYTHFWFDVRERERERNETISLLFLFAAFAAFFLCSEQL